MTTSIMKASRKHWLQMLVSQWGATFYRDWYGKWQIKARILISFYQVFVGVAPVFEIDFPLEFKQVLAYLGLLELNIFAVTPLSCFVNYDFQ